MYLSKNKLFQFVVLLLITILSSNAQQTRHGLVFYGGSGLIDSRGKGNWDKLQYQLGFSGGYRFRIKNPVFQSFHFDIDANFGIKRMKYGFSIDPFYNDVNNYIFDSHEFVNTTTYFTAISGTFNYSAFENFNAGLGFEPTYYFIGKSHRLFREHFGFPIIINFSYNFKLIEVGISCKYGLFDVLSLLPNSGRIGEIQLLIFLPFKSRKRDLNNNSDFFY